MAFALYQIRQQVEMLALIGAEREAELNRLALVVQQQQQHHLGHSRSGVGAHSTSSKRKGVINVHVVRDYDEPVQPYVKSQMPKPNLSRQNSSLFSMNQMPPQAKNGVNHNSTSSGLGYNYSNTNYSSDWTQAIDRSRSMTEDVRTVYDST
jgi:hypothetical protein